MATEMYNITCEEVYEAVKSSSKGLSSQEANYRLQENGANLIKEKKKKTFWSRLVDQLKNALMIIMMLSALSSIVVSIVENNPTELINAGLILIIVVIDVVLGMIEESKAEEAVNNLKDLTKPFAKVLRNEKITKIKTENIVVGDIVILEAGDIVPADIRLINVASLKIQDSALTGESLPSDKTAKIVDGKNIPLGDRDNMAFSGSVVTYGRGEGIVVATGMDTEMGKIANVLQEEQSTVTPLTQRLNKTVKILTYLIMTVSIIVFVTDLIKGNGIANSFMTAVALAVCVVPEGMSLCTTLTMAMGVQRMSKNKAIIRYLPAVETLGSTQVICTDKTGTLTLNKMVIKDIYILNRTNAEDEDLNANPNYLSLINCMLLCNDTTLRTNDDGTLSTMGDPTETALVDYGYAHDFNKDNFDGMFPRVNEIPFDSERKLMTTIHSINNKSVAYTKGAVDNILERCTQILDNGIPRPITADDKIMVLDQNFAFADKALRVLGYATKEVVGDVYDITSENVENDLIFVGLTGMIDPPREEVAAAIKECHQAGIITVMITGDHKDTAFAIARELGIATNINQVMTGKELDQITDAELSDTVNRIRVFARVNPEHKVRIVKAFKSQDKIVAMTGDGVNDAPSIKSADIGIGMGITGTDVTKDVADVVLTDDNFATIVGAVKEGRKIYSNILKNIQYLMGTGFCELIVLFVILVIINKDFMGPALILWLNFVSDTIPAMALGIEKADPDIMKQKPQKNRGNLFKGIVGFNIIVYGLLQAGITFAVFFGGLGCGLSHITVTTMCFVTIVALESFHAYNLKSETASLFSSNPFNNWLLNVGFFVSFALTFLFIIFPFHSLKVALGITYLTAAQWGICILAGFLIIPLGEIVKIFVRLHYKRKAKKSDTMI